MHSLLRDNDESLNGDQLWPDDPSLPEPPADAESADQEQPPDEPEPKHRKRSRAERNRQNAQHSTGPRTEAGKARSRRNALKHGSTGQIPHTLEDQINVNQITRELRSYYEPDSPLEQDLLQRIGIAQWRYWRAQATLSDVERMAMDGVEPDHAIATRLAVVSLEQPEQQAHIERHHRYLASADRLYQRAIHSFLQTRKQRIKEQHADEAFTNQEQRKDRASQPELYPSQYHSQAQAAMERSRREALHREMQERQQRAWEEREARQRETEQQPKPKKQDEAQRNEPSQPEPNQPLDSDESPQA